MSDEIRVVVRLDPVSDLPCIVFDDGSRQSHYPMNGWDVSGHFTCDHLWYARTKPVDDETADRMVEQYRKLADPYNTIGAIIVGKRLVR